MGLLDKIRSWVRAEAERENEREEEAGEQVVTVPAIDLVEPTIVPKRLLPMLWGIAELDLPLSYLTEQDMRWIQYRIELIARGATVIEPEEPHPELMRLLHRYTLGDLDAENASLWGYVRMKRATYALERKLQGGRIAGMGW